MADQPLSERARPAPPSAAAAAPSPSPNGSLSNRPSSDRPDPAAPADLPAGYPREWEADVLLTDGGTARLRPIVPGDAQRLIDFYARVSDESKYLRFFAPYPRLSARDVHQFTHTDYVDRVALILTVGEEMIAVGRYDRLPDTDTPGHTLSRHAEVAFLVEDAHQGRGIAQVLLEHLADAARERGITGFVADVLPQNAVMAQVFADAGYRVTRAFEDGVVQLEFPILPTDTSFGVMQRREHRAEASSVRRLLHPASIVLLGARARVQDLVDSVVRSGYTGRVAAVCVDGSPDTAWTAAFGQVVVADSVAEVGHDVDLVVAALPPADLGTVVIEAAHRGAHGLMVITGSGAVAGDVGGEDQGVRPAEIDGALLVGLVRAYGLRAVGPDALGLINTDPAAPLNASPAPMPRQGSVAMFCQSPAVGVAMLSGAMRLGLGLSSFVSTGPYADVTANDVMQYWEDDERSRVCLLSLDRIGNPRKFHRVIRRLTRRKPAVAYAPGQAERTSHSGDRGGLRQVSDQAVDALFRQSGVIVVHNRSRMYDIAQLVTRQPLPAGPRVRLVTNSRSLARQVARTIRGSGLIGAEPRVLDSTADVAELIERTRLALHDDECDAVLTAVVNPFGAITRDVHDALEELAGTLTKPLLGVFVEFPGANEPLGDTGPDEYGRLPTYHGQGDAVAALAAAGAYAHWRERDPGAVPMLDVDPDAARLVVNRALAADPGGRRLTEDEAITLLRAFGITLVPSYPVRTLAEAIAVGERLGWNVVLKAASERVRRRPDLAGVFRHLDTAEEMRHAWEDLAEVMAGLGPDPSAAPEPAPDGPDVPDTAGHAAAQADAAGLGAPGGSAAGVGAGVDMTEADALAASAEPVVQAMMPSGVSLVVTSREDPAFGPVLSLGLAGVASDLLGDVVYRVPPLTTVDAAAMVRDLKAAPLLFGWRGSTRVDVAAVELLLHKVAQLADALPQLATLTLGPCIASASGIHVLGAVVEIAPSSDLREPLTRTVG